MRIRSFTRVVFPHLSSTSMHTLQQVDSLLSTYYNAFCDKNGQYFRSY